MSTIYSISIDRLARLVGRPDSPLLIDVRIEVDFASDPRLIPGSVRMNHAQAPGWSRDFAGRDVVTICQKGLPLGFGGMALRRAIWRAAHSPGPTRDCR
jgi:rhodanese-related sulfurtransferase